MTTGSPFSIVSRLFVLVLLGSLGESSAAAGEPSIPGDVFTSFARHIQQQIQSDKQSFADAHVCTQWFYQQERKKPPRPPAQGVSFSAAHPSARPVLEMAQCPTRYPGGLEAARVDFSRTQSLLAFSLTFYEFALVGDANDDGRYSSVELQDIMGSIGLAFDEVRGSEGHLAALNAKFDTLRKAGGLETLMDSMGILYDKGYRFTSTDRDELNRISG
jgi:hypothetical protein